MLRLLLLLLLLLLFTYKQYNYLQMTLKPKRMDSVKSAQNVKHVSEVFKFQANPAFENLIENFDSLKQKILCSPWS